ncbi:MAG: hypothetical protein ACLTQI_03565 [Slackia sp.]
MSEQAKHKIAAFDFDGTSIRGNSPVILVRFLRSQGMLRKRVISKVLAWAAAYKLRLPQSEAWVRGLVFAAFGSARESVDAFLSDFYDRNRGAGSLPLPGRRGHEPSAKKRGGVVRVGDVRPIVRRALVSTRSTAVCAEMRVGP